MKQGTKPKDEGKRTTPRWELVAQLVVLAAIGALTYGILRPMFDKIEGRSPQYLTYVKLERLKWMIMTFYWQYGELPDKGSWKRQLLDASDEMHFVIARIQSCSVDEWKNDIVYIPDSESFIVYSFGKNRSDDDMQGDDIVVKCSKEDLN